MGTLLAGPSGYPYVTPLSLLPDAPPPMPESSETPSSHALALFGVVAGPRRGDELPVLSPVVTIGQGPQNDIVLDDDSVSRNHARLELELGSWMITDLDSTNGTEVEGVRLAPGVPTPLAYASTVRFGGVRLQFREVEEADLEAARAAFTPADAAGPDRPRHFRLPVWVLVLILVLAALAIFLVTGLTGAAAPLP